MFSGDATAEVPLVDGLSHEKKERAAKRLCALFYRFGADEPRWRFSRDGTHVRIDFTYTAPSRAAASGIVFAIRDQAYEATRFDSYDFVDEYPWPEDQPSEDLPGLRDEIERLLTERRLQFEVYPMPSPQGGLVVELHDVGGATPQEATTQGRAIVAEVYAEAYGRVTGKAHVARHRTIGGIGGAPESTG